LAFERDNPKETIMKRLIFVAAIAVISASALADVGKPFEQLEIDRLLPVIPESRITGVDYPFGGTPPYNQLDVDLALPDVDVRPSATLVALGGNTRSDVELSVGMITMNASPWASDHNFIAPPQ
jgi:hypothetical protein